MISNTAGATVGTFTYNPFGGVQASAGSTSSKFGFASAYADSETGLLFLNARYYDPNVGEFITADPLANLTNQNYAYASQDPINLTDPSGLWGWNPISDVEEAGSDVGNAIGSGTTWVVEHPGQAAEAVAGGVCIVASDGVCAGAVFAAFGVSTYENTQHPDFWGHEAVTAGETALFGGAGLIKTGLGVAGAFETTLADGTTVSALPESFWGNAALNATFTWPALVGIGLEGLIDQANFCES